MATVEGADALPPEFHARVHVQATAGLVVDEIARIAREMDDDLVVLVTKRGVSQDSESRRRDWRLGVSIVRFGRAARERSSIRAMAIIEASKSTVDSLADSAVAAPENSPTGRPDRSRSRTLLANLAGDKSSPAPPLFAHPHHAPVALTS